MKRSFPTTDKYQCPECDEKLNKQDDKVVDNLYFCSECSNYCYVEVREVKGAT